MNITQFQRQKNRTKNRDNSKTKSGYNFKKILFYIISIVLKKQEQNLSIYFFKKIGRGEKIRQLREVVKAERREKHFKTILIRNIDMADMCHKNGNY